MTREELKEVFYKYKFAEKNKNILRNRLVELRMDMTAISSALGNIGMPSGGGENSPKIERIADKLMEVEKRYLTAIETFMTAEDRLHEAFAVADLTAEERDVLIESYMNGKPAWKVAMDIGWSERTVKRRRINAVKKLCEK